MDFVDIEWEKVDAYAVAKNVCGNLKEIAAKKQLP